MSNIKSIGTRKVEDQTLREGEGTSFKFGESNQVVSENSVVFGDSNSAGQLAYYIKSIDTVNKKIYLSKDKVTCEISEIDNTDISFETPAYDKEKDFSFILSTPNGRSHWHFVGSISNVSNNVITCNINEFPFTEIADDAADYSPTFYVPEQPNVGVVNIGYASNAEGNQTFASGKCSHAEGYKSVVSGMYGHAEGRNTRAGYASHAEGYLTKAYGNYSHTEGLQCKTNNGAVNSHADILRQMRWVLTQKA